MNPEPVQQALPRTASNPGRGRRVVKHFADFLRHMRRRWVLYLPIFAIWGLAYGRLFIDATPRLPVLFRDYAGRHKRRFRHRHRPATRR